jgi:SAM-dependent methyltransferase
MAEVFPDHFSAAAPAYARFRPRYPAALFAWLAGLSPSRSRAWDCAAGSGQAAASLAHHFGTVIATDASRDQLRAADPGGLRRVVSLAEATPIRSATIDLVTVAQALHWFAIPAFFAEVHRCLVPDGICAIWTYARCSVDPLVDVMLDHFHDRTLAGCWPAERALVEEGYRSLDLPIIPTPAPRFTMSAKWDLDSLLGYVGTWSAVRVWERQRGISPIPALRDQLQQRWAPQSWRTVRWPLQLRAGRLRPL